MKKIIFIFLTLLVSEQLFTMEKKTTRPPKKYSKVIEASIPETPAEETAMSEQDKKNKRIAELAIKLAALKEEKIKLSSEMAHLESEKTNLIPHETEPNDFQATLSPAEQNYLPKNTTNQIKQNFWNFIFATNTWSDHFIQMLQQNLNLLNLYTPQQRTEILQKLFALSPPLKTLGTYSMENLDTSTILDAYGDDGIMDKILSLNSIKTLKNFDSILFQTHNKLNTNFHSNYALYAFLKKALMFKHKPAFSFFKYDNPLIIDTPGSFLIDKGIEYPWLQKYFLDKVKKEILSNPNHPHLKNFLNIIAPHQDPFFSQLITDVITYSTIDVHQPLFTKEALDNIRQSNSGQLPSSINPNETLYEVIKNRYPSALPAIDKGIQKRLRRMAHATYIEEVKRERKRTVLPVQEMIKYFLHTEEPEESLPAPMPEQQNALYYGLTGLERTIEEGKRAHAERIKAEKERYERENDEYGNDNDY